ncbi:uncharacterized protein [Clytia hemisphaerica]|uniref:Uncharacterized protein n=1 Tax=Clytia hemisphaerica TaxID=252671 RepID=A0A7M5X2I9_9CNID|eukprot:TCONS_00003911-protein
MINSEMIRMLYKYMVILSTLILYTQAQTQPRSQPEYHSACAPVLSYVETNPDHKFEPLVVKLHRCVGKNRGSSSRKECVPETMENVTFYVDDYSGRFPPPTAILSNHTSCKEKCRLNSSVCNENQSWDQFDCSCTCAVQSPPKCEDPLYWDSRHCACVCPKQGRPKQCNKFKYFSEDSCGCICEPKRERKCRRQGQFLDPDTCYCTQYPPYVEAQEAFDCSHEGVISKVGLVLLIIFEAFAIVIAFVMYRKYCASRAPCNRPKHYQHADDTLPDDRSLDGNEHDKYSIDTPTIGLQSGQIALKHRTQNTNNNKLYINNGGAGKTSSSSYDVLIKEQSTEYLHDQTEPYDWRQSYKDMVKV